jgi:taurine dioxygenase
VDIQILEGVGAEIRGIDIGNLSEAEFADIRSTFNEQGLLFFREQDIEEEQHIAFAERWGDININRFFEAHERFPQIAMVRKEPEQETNIGGGWHTDHSYDEIPALGSILVARELPASGGDTWFASMYKAYESLSSGLQATLENLNAVHSARHIFGSDNAYDQLEDIKDCIGNAVAADQLPDPIHPTVITHPLSGKKALYVNPGFTRSFEGWTREESLPLLKYLYECAQQETSVTRFHWQPGSIAFWDNRATWHYALNDYHGQRRVMHRITLEGEPLST